MYIIHHPGEVPGQSHPGIDQVVSQRILELKLIPEEALTDLGEFIIVEPGDTISGLEEVSGCAIATDLFGEAHFGETDFAPSFEWLQYHTDQKCFEMVFVMNDDGYFTVFLVPDDPGIDVDLLSLCREYS